MAMDYKSFLNNRKNRPTNDESKEDLKKTAERYAEKSDAELLGDILKAVQKEKAEGTYSDQKLREFVEKVSPMLTTEQRTRLMQVIKMIKSS